MKRVFLFVVVIFVINTISLAQKIKGTVKDENNEPMVGVNVSLKDSYMGATTNVKGKFSIKLKPGDHTLVFSYIGYKKIEKSVNLSEGEKSVSIKMQPKAVVTEDVIVEATRASENTPTSHETMDKEEIEERQMVKDIPYMIETTPSVVATSESGTGIGYTSFRIRGTDPTRINITIDGIPYNDAESHGTFWVNMPDFTNSIQSVQIQRGVGTSTNGAGAFGATMNFKTKGINAKPYSEFDLAGGSFNTLKGSVMAGTGLINDHFTMDARFSKVLSEGYIDRAFVDHKSFSLSAAYRGENDLVKANIIHGNQVTGISWWGTPADSLQTNRTFNPAGMYMDENGNIKYYDGQTDNYLQTHYHLHYTHVFNKHLNMNISGHYTRGDGYYKQYKDTETAHDPKDVSLDYYGLPNVNIGDSVIKKSDLIRRMMMGNDFYGGLFSVNYNEGRWNATIGGGWNKYDGDHFGELIWMRYASTSEINERFYDNTGIKTDANIYGKINYSITENLNAFGDIQYRHINYKMKGKDYNLMPEGSNKTLNQKHKFDFFNPKAGLYYKINDRMNTYASFSAGHREPTRTHFKDATGDPEVTPEPETLYDYELGYNYKSKNLATGINLYYMDYDNQLIPTGEKSSVGYDIMTNVNKSFRRGIEIMTSAKITDFFNWNFNLTLSQNKIRDYTYWATYYDEDFNTSYKSKTIKETNIAYSPQVIGSNILRFKILEDLNINISSKYVGKQYFDNLSSEQRKIDSYLINDLQINYNFKTKLLSDVDIRLQINNIFDTKYYNNAYGGVWYEQGDEKSWAYYFPQAGINFMAGLTIKI